MFDAHSIFELLNQLQRGDTLQTMREGKFKDILVTYQRNSAAIEVHSKYHHLLFEAQTKYGISDQDLQKICLEPLEDVRRRAAVGRSTELMLSDFDIAYPPTRVCLPGCELVDVSKVKMNSSTGQGLEKVRGNVYLSIAVTTVACALGLGKVCSVVYADCDAF